jgi:hypothetical protein
MGPITIFDKSALQALSMDESVWFDAFFLTNVTPLFYVETLADLEKAVATGRTPESVVGTLAAKTPNGATPNVHHRSLIGAELQGVPVPMTLGQIPVGPGKRMRSPDGTIGVHIDEFPEEAALHRWKNHEFLEIERSLARLWRAELAVHDPRRVTDWVAEAVPARARANELSELKQDINIYCASEDEQVLRVALELVGLPEASREQVVERWEQAGRPQLEEFAPYTMHVFKVDLLYYLGMKHKLIYTGRPSNKIDMAYIYYLPFSMVFVSGDKLHHKTAPLFLRENQSYVEAKVLKSALAELDSHYDRLPEKVKARGVMSFAKHPPAELDNAVTRLWDRHMPRWRENADPPQAAGAEVPERPSDVDALRDRIERAQPVERDGAVGLEDADYFVIRRQVPVTKGKWRLLPDELQRSDSDE